MDGICPESFGTGCSVQIKAYAERYTCVAMVSKCVKWKLVNAEQKNDTKKMTQSLDAQVTLH